MLQTKILAVAVILFLGSMSSEVDTKTISKRHVRHDWLIIPDAIAFKLFELVNKTSPKTAEFLADFVQSSPIILETRNYLIKKTANISVLIKNLAEKVFDFVDYMKKELNEPAQQ